MSAKKRKSKKTKNTAMSNQMFRSAFNAVFKNEFTESLSMNVLAGISMGVVILGLSGWMVFTETTFAVSGDQNKKSSEPGFMPIQKVVVEGKFKNADLKKLEAMVSRYANAGFFNVDVNKIESVASKVDWIRSASVRRVWPDTLKIIIDEHDVFAVWNNDSLVNNQGELFHPAGVSANYSSATDSKEILPKLSGPEGSHDTVLAKYKQIESELAVLGLHITELEMDGRYSWQLLLDNNVRLLFGREQVDEAIQRFVTIFGGSFARNLKDIRHVDLRYTNGIAVSWKTKKVNSDIKNSDSLRGNI